MRLLIGSRLKRCRGGMVLTLNRLTGAKGRPMDAAVAQGALLAVKNIEVIYDHVILVLRGVSLEVPQGGIVALLGGNGAGKSTTLKAVSTLLAAERGAVTKGSIDSGGDAPTN